MNSASSSMTKESETIAIIEDDAGVRASLVRLLSALGYHTELYDSAEEFLGNLDQCKADCFIIDVHLGGMSGLDLAQHPTVVALKRPIILNSASDDVELRKQAIAAGCAAFLCKPFTATELLGALVRAAERRPTPYDE
jgi:FixJ family two-component response regulator